jgi:succinate dehydrogenase / fumarate reductase, cytochrome b subunit
VSRPLSRSQRLWRSTIGKKIVMAATGIVLLSFVVIHMLGNLGVFAGAASFDAYGRWLREIGSPMLGEGVLLWILRGGLLVALVLHVTAAVQLTRRAKAARPAAQAHRAPVRGGFAARTMRWGGLVIAVFLVFHLLDLTFGVLNPHGVPGEIHRNVVSSLGRPAVALGHAIALLALGLHVRHGIWSALQTLGLRVGREHRRIAGVLALALTLGFLAVPVAVVLGVVG